MRSSGLEAIDFPVMFLAAYKSAERGGGNGGAARAGEPKLPQAQTTEPDTASLRDSDRLP